MLILHVNDNRHSIGGVQAKSNKKRAILKPANKLFLSKPANRAKMNKECKYFLRIIRTK